MVAPIDYREVSTNRIGGLPRQGNTFEMLERYAVKVARTVLRGGSGSNVTSLPDKCAV